MAEKRVTFRADEQLVAWFDALIQEMREAGELHPDMNRSKLLRQAIEEYIDEFEQTLDDDDLARLRRKFEADRSVSNEGNRTPAAATAD